MTSWRLIAAAFCVAIATIASPVLPSDVAEPLAQDLIHSDLPLYMTGNEAVWPQHFTDDDGSFGCTSRVAFGVWRLKHNDDDDNDEWWRIENYGVFHCALMAKESYSQERLARSSSRHGFFVRLGTVKFHAKSMELWALQLGTRPGSDYVLLARQPSEGLIKSFTVLQRDCPKSKVRTGPSMDTFRMDYCSINTPAELLELAKSMLMRPPLGTFEWVSKAPEAPESD